MKIFLDTEFVERGPLIPLKPISIALVREDGEEFYGINAECLTDVFRHKWLSMNVLPWLPAISEANIGISQILAWDTDHADYPHVMALDSLAEAVRTFIVETPDPELWAWYGAYDHVILCQMFGTMAELPTGIPMYTCELMQEWNRLGRPPVPKDPTNAHHALADARWARDMWMDWQLAEAAAVIEDAVILDDGDAEEVLVKVKFVEARDDDDQLSW